MKKLLLSLTVGLGMSLSTFAGSHRIYMTAPDYSAIDDLLEAQAQAQYEAQIQQQLDDIVFWQQYIEELLNNGQ